MLAVFVESVLHSMKCSRPTFLFFDQGYEQVAIWRSSGWPSFSPALRSRRALSLEIGGSMSKPWSEQPLWWKVYCSDDRYVYLNAGKIIGHLGCSPFDFFDAAKKLPDYNQHRYECAVCDLTLYGPREASPPRYELTVTARELLRVILGPTPDDPEYRRWWELRLISVKLAREKGTPILWAEEPPVPLEPSKEEPLAEPKKRIRKKKTG